MSPERTDTLGRSESAYVEHVLSEAERDIVAFGDIVSWGRNQFEMTDAELDAFVRKVLRALLNSGVKIVRPTEIAEGYRWDELKEYDSSNIEACVEALIVDSDGFDPDQDFFAWFVFAIPGIFPRVSYVSHTI